MAEKVQPAKTVEQSKLDPKYRPSWESYLRKDEELKVVGFNDVPYHPLFGTETQPAVALSDFIGTLCVQVKSWNPQQWEKNGKRTEHGIGGSPVEIHQTKTKKNDKWFARYCEFRQGDHDPHYEELDHVLRLNHSDHEAKYTDEIFDHQSILKWDPADGQLAEIEKANNVKNINLEIVQMYHKLGNGLDDRVFTVILLSGTRDDPSMDTRTHDIANKEFFVVQLPVDLSSFPISVRSKSHAKDNMVYQPQQPQHDPNGTIVQLTRDQEARVGKTLSEGRYASVERVCYLAGPYEGDPRPASDYPCTSWSMSTASDARIRNLPKFTYQFVVPKKIAMDVKYVCEYIEKNRGSPGWPTVSTSG